MKFRWLHTGILLTSITLSAWAEWPTYTQKPDHKFSSWETVPSNLESLAGEVLEIKDCGQCLLGNTEKLNEFYRGLVTTSRNEDSGVSFSVDIPREGLLCIRNPGPLYVLVTKDQHTLVAIGNSYIKNKDRTVQYAWKEERPLTPEERSHWFIDDALKLAEFFPDPEPILYVSCFGNRLKEFHENSETGERACVYGSQDTRITYSSEGDNFFEDAADGVFIKFYAKFITAEDGKITLQALGTRRKGKGEKATYKW